MTWTSPRTWLSGERVLASLLNTHLRDNLLALYNRRLHVLAFADKQASGVSPATVTFGGWRTRVMNTEVLDTGAYGAVSANKMTLQPGKYIGIGFSSQQANQAHMVSIYNVTGTTYYMGSAVQYFGSTSMVVTPELTLTVATDFELRHYLITADAAPGPTMSLGTDSYYCWVIWLRTGEA